jgi:EmrB/QacA subfamily drug resistance transporter
VCCTALFITSLDNTIVNVALPSLQRDLHARTSGLQWTIDSYILVRASLLFVGGFFADRFGRRRFFSIGLFTFTAGSLACGMSSSLSALIAFRALQGAGGALMTPASLAVLTNTFQGARQRARAVGIWSATAGLSTACGPLLGGLLVEVVGWRSVFWVNVPIGIAALASTRLLGESSNRSAPKEFDIRGQVLITLTLGTLTYALISGPEAGWSSTQVFLLASAAALAGGFVLNERYSSNPLIDLRYFKNPTLSGAVWIALVVYLAFGGFLFFNTLYLQDIRGFSPLEAGVLMVPGTLAVLILAPWAGRVTGSRGARLPATLACTLIAVAMGLMALFIAPATPIWLIVVASFVLGCGMGLVNPPATNAAVSSMPPEQAGVASATTSTARQVGINLGIALLGSIVFSTATTHRVGPSTLHSVAGISSTTFTHGLYYGYLVSAVLALASALLAGWAFRPTRSLGLADSTGQADL